MATTIVACALRYDRAAVAHVGDSRCYLIRRGQAAILTRDHTVANEHVRLGILSADEAASARNASHAQPLAGKRIDRQRGISEHQVFAGDVLLLCSDGLHGSVTASEMAAVAGHGGDLAVAGTEGWWILPTSGTAVIISACRLIRVRSVERVGMYRGRPYRLP